MIKHQVSMIVKVFNCSTFISVLILWYYAHFAGDDNHDYPVRESNPNSIFDSSEYRDVGTYPCYNVLMFQILPTFKNKPNKRTIPLATIGFSPLTHSLAPTSNPISHLPIPLSARATPTSTKNLWLTNSQPKLPIFLQRRLHHLRLKLLTPPEAQKYT